MQDEGERWIKSMNKTIKFLILGLILTVLIVAILNYQSIMPRQREIIKPPPAILKLDGKEQVSGIGSYCWNGDLSSNGELNSLCADYVGPQTPDEPLPAISPFTAHLSLPIEEIPQELHFNVFRVTDDDEIKLDANGSRSWHIKEENLKQGIFSTLTPERESDINLSLEPGLYVLRVSPRWKEKGSVSYGFLLNVSKKTLI